MAVTYDYFGASPVVVIFKTSSQFDGTAQTGTAVINKGTVTFPSQTAGGLMNFHKRPLIIHSVHINGGGSGAISVVYADATEIVMNNFTNQDYHTYDKIYLPVGASLKITSSGGSSPKIAKITATEVVPNQGL